MLDRGQQVTEQKRSEHWPRVEEAFKVKNPRCACCGGTENLNVHHVMPFHLCIAVGRPDLELDDRNLVTLCRGPFNCHLLFGHLGDFKGFNPLVLADAAIWRFRLRARKVILRLAKERNL